MIPISLNFDHNYGIENKTASVKIMAWALSQYPKRRLSVRSRKVSKPGDLYLELSNRSEIWQALGSSAADVPVKFQSDTTIQSTNLVASRLYKILQKDVVSDIETGPWYRKGQHHYRNHWWARLPTNIRVTRHRWVYQLVALAILYVNDDITIQLHYFITKYCSVIVTQRIFEPAPLIQISFRNLNERKALPWIFGDVDSVLE